ncbi:MAG TPA: response regulator [Fimbriiglobus sp.]|nr:response regulator [Fimbriiglobus sp.]
MTPTSDGTGPPPGCRVLVADGNPDTAESLAVLLRLHGHEVATAHTGPDALAAARSLRPDAVFLSILLHGMTGYEVARQLRAELNEKLVLIAMTGFAREEDRQLALAAGFDYHLVKPADPNVVLALLHAGLTTQS